MGSTGNEHDLVAGFGESAADDTTDRPRTDHDEPHSGIVASRPIGAPPRPEHHATRSPEAAAAAA
jgi:hypothetical protein